MNKHALHFSDKVENSTVNNGIYAKLKCKSMSDDYQSSVYLEEKYPGRFTKLYFEDLVTAPLKITKLIYIFLHLEYTEDVEKYVKQITRSDSDGCLMCTNRKNSSAHANEWRHSLSFAEVKVIDSHCMKTYKQYGFLPVENETLLQNTSCHLRQPLSESSLIRDYVTFS